MDLCWETSISVYLFGLHVCDLCMLWELMVENDLVFVLSKRDSDAGAPGALQAGENIYFLNVIQEKPLYTQTYAVIRAVSLNWVLWEWEHSSTGLMWY